jgi:uncharacterized protein YbbK (DUF523 family)
MQKILISSCLLGFPVRYDGNGFLPKSEIIKTWLREERLIAYCPEVEGGLTVPRPAAELVGGDGQDVIAQKARVRSQVGEDLTESYLKGAEKALEIVQVKDIQIAVLKSNSPACGFGKIYDGSFSGKLRPGEGVTAAILSRKGIKIFTENQLSEAKIYLNQIEQLK